MSVHMIREIENLKKRILGQAALVEERVEKAVKALLYRDEKMARDVVEGDPEIDRLEVELEEECLKILALYQPVASDLRFIVAVLKINSDLERIGDLAVNTAEKVIALQKFETEQEIPIDFSVMANKAKHMLRNCLDALINYNTQEAYQVCIADDEVDQLHRETYNIVEQNILKNPRNTGFLNHLLGISRNFERIADHATNIAEDVIYLTNGEIIRHRVREWQAKVL